MTDDPGKEVTGELDDDQPAVKTGNEPAYESPDDNAPSDDGSDTPVDDNGKGTGNPNKTEGEIYGS